MPVNIAIGIRREAYIYSKDCNPETLIWVEGNTLKPSNQLNRSVNNGPVINDLSALNSNVNSDEELTDLSTKSIFPGYNSIEDFHTKKYVD